MSDSPKRDCVKELANLLRDGGAELCFCNLCKHQPQYGHCYVCPCHNSRERPAIPDPAKLLATVDYLRDLLIQLCRDGAR